MRENFPTPKVVHWLSKSFSVALNLGVSFSFAVATPSSVAV